MPITQALCNSFKEEILQGVHLASHTYKIALFTSAATLNKSTTTYLGQSGEVAAGGGYAAGGQELAGFTTGLDGDAAYLDWSTDPSWNPSTITARGALIYNDSLPGKNAVAVVDFGKDFASVNNEFKIVFPAPAAATALIVII
jgi:hypothetical protein